jgi:hypothetical protein
MSRAVDRWRYRERRDAPRRLALDADGLAARAQHLQERGLAQQPAGEEGGRVEHVLAVVQHDEAAGGGEVPHDSVGRGRPGDRDPERPRE